MKRTHGHSRPKASPTYSSWRNMVNRRTNPRVPFFEDYGGAGITVCARWRSFEAFLADMGERPTGTTIDRINNAKDYEPGNCRWATKQEQSANRSSAHLLTIQGRTLTLAEWARGAGLPRSTLRRRLALGWPLERAVGLLNGTGTEG